MSHGTVSVKLGLRSDDVTPVDSTSQYFGWLRHDVLRHVPATARRILSVGCGAGLTEAELVRRGAHVVGIEKDESAAQVAQSRGVHVLQGDAFGMQSKLQGRTFDCLIYADVLEHLPDPERLLAHHVTLLEAGGSVVISVPNFRHYRVFTSLFVRGCIQYEDSGIFDRTHLRITTRKMVQQWMHACGLSLVSCEYRMNRRRERYFAFATCNLAREFLATQVIVTAIKND